MEKLGTPPESLPGGIGMSIRAVRAYEYCLYWYCVAVRNWSLQTWSQGPLNPIAVGSVRRSRGWRAALSLELGSDAARYSYIGLVDPPSGPCPPSISPRPDRQDHLDRGLTAPPTCPDADARENTPYGPSVPTGAG
jgi:hypothetical protein